MRERDAAVIAVTDDVDLPVVGAEDLLRAALVALETYTGAPDWLLLVTGLLAIIYAIKRFAAQEPAGPSIGLIAAGVLIGLWFVIRQLRAERPLLDVRLFANRTVSGALAVFLCREEARNVNGANWSMDGGWTAE